MTPLHETGTPVASVGRPVERVEDLRLLKGKGCYVDDVAGDDVLHAVILRSPVAHGLIRRIDTSAALDFPGVRAVFTATDISAVLKGTIPRIPLRQDPLPQLQSFEQPVIADTTVRYVGEPIVVVVADDAALAEDALEAIVLEIDSLPVIADRAAAARQEVLLFEGSGTNCALTLSAVRGDTDAAFAAAAYTRRERFRVHRHTAVPMETRGLRAEWDASRGKLSVYGAAKVPFANRRMLAERIGLAVDAIEMVECDVGGAFGVRGEFYPEDFLIPFAAMRLGRAVKWIEDRREHLTATNHARDAECELEIACDASGMITGLRGHAQTDVGAYLRTTGVTPSRNVAQVSSGPYRIPNVRVDVSLILTNKTPVGTYRGPGRFETDFFRERLFDMAAADLGIDRVEFRRRNLVTQSEIPYALPTLLPYNGETSTDSGNYHVTLDRCLAEFDWATKSRLNGKLIDGRYHGLGIGCYIEGGASGPKESARLVLETDGTISVYVGSSAVGQGLETVLTQIAADALYMPLSSIRGVFHGSTSTVKDGYGSYSSRSTVMGGSAILDAAQALLAKIRETAAARFGCAPDEIDIVAGREVRGPGGKSVTLAELTSAPLTAEGSFTSSKRTYSYGAHAAHVAVNPRTGHVELIDYVAVEDVGRIINPHTLHGQTVGAIVQGLGGVFLEHLVYSDDAQLLTGSLADYLMPTAGDFPNIRAVALELFPSPHNPLGAKGAGEGGIIPVGGVIANAVGAALGSLGVEPRELPLSPPRIWQLIQDAA
ncbi:MAG: carbon-monoxide dehydrogenase [Betaproteobacteria bacterium]|nr:carbon-monoxide dehydrogenase [Betaproteobacteria bacterium]